MAVSSVHTSTDATAQAIAQSKKTATTLQTQNNAASNVRQKAQTQAQAPQAPKPVVNSQGQKTGQVLNTTA